MYLATDTILDDMNCDDQFYVWSVISNERVENQDNTPYAKDLFHLQHAIDFAVKLTESHTFIHTFFFLQA